MRSLRRFYQNNLFENSKSDVFAIPKEDIAGEYSLMQSKAIFSVLVVALVAVSGVFGVTYMQQNSELNSLRNSLNTANAQNTQLNANVSSMQTQKQSLETEILQLNSSITALQSQKATLQERLVQEEANLTQAEGNITILDNQISVLNTQIQSLNSQVSNLNSVVQLQDSQEVALPRNFVTNSTGMVEVASLAATDAGYVSIQITSASDYAKEGIFVLDMYSSSVHSSHSGIYLPSSSIFYPFDRLFDTIAVPVVPGQVTIYLATSDTTAQSATLAMTYWS